MYDTCYIIHSYLLLLLGRSMWGKVTLAVCAVLFSQTRRAHDLVLLVS